MREGNASRAIVVVHQRSIVRLAPHPFWIATQISKSLSSLGEDSLALLISTQVLISIEVALPLARAYAFPKNLPAHLSATPPQPTTCSSGRLYEICRRASCSRDWEAMPGAIKKGETKEVKSTNFFTIAEGGTLSFGGLSCEIYDNKEERVGPIGDGSSMVVTKGWSCYVQKGTVTLE